MEFRIVELPAFRAAASDVDRACDFSSEGILGKFNAYFSVIEPAPRDSFLPRDFLYYDEAEQGLVWMWALCDGADDDGGNRILDFDGGYYLTYAYKDGDDAANGELYRKALAYIADSEHLELDVRPNHYPMGHIITPAPIIAAQGWAQMQTYIPVKLKNA